MASLSISHVAQRVGLRASTIRYYEKIGLLPSPQRVSGQRRYDSSALYRLAVVQGARKLGFTLGEIRELFFGFRGATKASQRWQKLSQRKLEELDEMMRGISAVRGLLKKLIRNCACETLEQCGRGMYQNHFCGEVPARSRRRLG